MNLLTNAAKYTASRGQIDVSARAHGNQVVLSVKDNGIGIPTALLPRVFDLFVQGPQDTDRAEGGLGLGLTIVRSLVELHGGSVEARSDGTGRGSVFIVRLPAAADARPLVRAPQRLRGSRLRQLKVLVVDDNADAAAMIAEALSTFGDITRTALDGPSALDVAKEFRPDVALLDIGLPVMDGYELGERLLSASADGRPVLIAITGYGQENDRARSTSCGFSAHMIKPVDLRKLNTLLDQVASGDLSPQTEPPRRA
jgi:CheY-like chemotaxis protein/anti-sigma regulatory factor (Ser/Thr protein kinase)